MIIDVCVNLENGEINRQNDEINRQNDGVNLENDGLKFLVSDEGITKLTSIQLKMVELMYHNPDITQKELKEQMKIDIRTVERNINVLKQKGIVERIGSKKTGYWKVL